MDTHAMIPGNVSRTIPDATRVEDGETVFICGMKCQFDQYCTLTARVQGYSGQPACHRHKGYPIDHWPHRQTTPVKTDDATIPKDVSRTPPPDTRIEDGQAVSICGVECSFRGIEGTFYCTLTATHPRESWGRSTCQLHKRTQVYHRVKKDGTVVQDQVISSTDPEDAFSRSVRVDNLSGQTTSEELFTHFKSCGDISWLSIVHDKMTGKPLGHAFLTFCKAESAQKALKFSFISDLHGRIMRVFPKERKIEEGFIQVIEPTTPLTERSFFWRHDHGHRQTRAV